MNLQAAIQIYGGGPGSGCEGPNCGRKPSSDPSSPQVVLRQEHSDMKWMRLTLNNPHIPLLFDNDTTSWNVDKKKGLLHIEVTDHELTDNPYEYGVKTVYDVPLKNIKQWVPATGQVGSDRWRTPKARAVAAAVLRAYAVKKGRRFGGN